MQDFNAEAIAKKERTDYEKLSTFATDGYANTKCDLPRK